MPLVLLLRRKALCTFIFRDERVAVGPSLLIDFVPQFLEGFLLVDIYLIPPYLMLKLLSILNDQHQLPIATDDLSSLQ